MMTWGEIAFIVSQLRSDEDRKRFNELINGAFCEGPECERFGELRRQNTQYADPLCNWARLCEEHAAEAYEFWAEQWREYYASVMPCY